MIREEKMRVVFLDFQAGGFDHAIWQGNLCWQY